MIWEIIKDNMEYFDMSNSDLALITGMEARTIRNIVSGKTKPSLESLTKFEDAFKLERGDLYPYLGVEEEFEVSDIIFNVIDDATENIYAKETILNKIRKLFNGSIENFKELLMVKSVDYYKFNENDLVYLWMALNNAKAVGKKPTGEYDRNKKTRIFNSYLEIMFSEGDFKSRVNMMTEELSDNGIVLINSPFISKSTIRGATFKKSSSKYIFMSDMNKREYAYIFALGHEIRHINGFALEDNNVLADKIKKHLEKNNIDHEIKKSFELYESKQNNEKFTSEDWEYLRMNTKLKINFGDQKEFIKEYVL